MVFAKGWVLTFTGNMSATAYAYNKDVVQPMTEPIDLQICVALYNLMLGAVWMLREWMIFRFFPFLECTCQKCDIVYFASMTCIKFHRYNFSIS